ncbi:MAG TPA: PIN domain-containing protein [Terracidiphilus sp.]|nr:PIN domain-containing protein [Terracidiphilus sp.]
MQPKSRKRKQRAVVDTNVVVAGISGFRDQYIPGRVPSADLMYRWADEEHFTWLYTEDILAEYKEVLKRLHVRPATVGAFINLIRERGEVVEVRAAAEISPDPKDDPFCACSETGRADMIFTLNPKDFPQSRLKAKVLAPMPVSERRSR